MKKVEYTFDLSKNVTDSRDFIVTDGIVTVNTPSFKDENGKTHSFKRTKAFKFMYQLEAQNGVKAIEDYRFEVVDKKVVTEDWLNATFKVLYDALKSEMKSNK